MTKTTAPTRWLPAGAGAARWGLGLGLALWGAEVFGATQLRATFQVDGIVVGLAAIYASFGLIGAWAGGRGVHRALTVLAALALAIFCYGELILFNHPVRLGAAVGVAVLVPLADRALGRWLKPLTRVGLLAVGWVLASTQTSVPRQILLAVLDGRWGAAAGAVLGVAVIVAVTLLLLASARAFARRPMRGLALGLLWAALGAGAFTGLGQTAPAAPQAQPRGDVIYVVLDSLRGDMLTPAQMPALWSWAADGTRYDDAHSPSISTRYSLPRMLALPEAPQPMLKGRWAAQRDGWATGLPARAQAAGLRAHLISDYAGNALGNLEAYAWDHVTARPARALLLPRLPITLIAIARGGDDRLRAARGSKAPFAHGSAIDDLAAAMHEAGGPGLYLLHLAVPHAPYNQPPYRAAGADAQPLPETRALNEQLRLGPTRGQLDPQIRTRMYHQAVRAADAEVARLRSLLAARSGTPPLVIITADHGESLGGRGVAGHGRSLFADGHHVPLVLIGPGVAPATVVDAPVSNAQLPAPILAWLGGDDLRLKPASPLVVWHPRGAVVQTDGWRLIWSQDARQLTRPDAWAHRQQHQLFEVRNDRAEATDRFAETPPALTRLLDMLEGATALPAASRAAAKASRP